MSAGKVWQLSCLVRGPRCWVGMVMLMNARCCQVGLAEGRNMSWLRC
jgi:hypothetical protein